MSPFPRTLRVYSLDRTRSIAVEALVDTGSSYSMVPAPLLEELGIAPEQELRSILADERVMLQPVAEVQVEVEEQRTHTWCIFGTPDSQPLIGAYTLEGARLMVDPVNERLVPLVGLLK